MAIKIFSCQAQGLTGKLIEVEVDIIQGLSAFTIVGLGDCAVQESKERIRSSIKNSSTEYPRQKKIINLAPANLKKTGPQFDLPIAIGLLSASGQIDPEHFKNTLIAGELALDGSVRPINGVLTLALFAKKNNWQKIIIPAENLAEANLVKGITLFGANHLKEIINESKKRNIQNIFVKSGSILPKSNSTPTEKTFKTPASPNNRPFDEVKGQIIAKRALSIAAAGGHHIALTGSPGVGKTLLAKALPDILPPLTEEEKLEVTQIHSVAGILQSGKLINERPFRQVHPTSSLISLLGGGPNLKPGEISLAHRGILFLDELPEFPRQHLENLRQPLQDKEIHISRASGTIKYPAGFTLVAGLNPCPCGYFGDTKRECVCRPAQIIQYQKKISGPIFDRIDIIISLPRQSTKVYISGSSVSKEYSSEQLSKKIIQARKIQEKRYKNHKISNNSEMTPTLISQYCMLEKETAEHFLEVAEQLSLSGRQYFQILKTARTIADMEESSNITLPHISEALQYRKQSFNNQI